MVPESVNAQEHDRQQDLPPQFGDAEDQQDFREHWAKSLSFFKQTTAGRQENVACMAPPCRRDLFLGRLAELMSLDRKLFGQVPVAEDFNLIKDPFGKTFFHRLGHGDVGTAVEGLIQLADVDDSHAAGELAIIETAFGDSPGQGRLAAGIAQAIRRPRTAVKALVAAGRGLAVAGTRTATDPFAVFALMNAPVDVVEDHQTCTPRSRATSSRVRSCLKPSKVALIRLIGLVEPKHLVRMSVMPADSTTARTASPALMPVPGRAGISRTLAVP